MDTRFVRRYIVASRYENQGKYKVLYILCIYVRGYGQVSKDQKQDYEQAKEGP